MAFSYDVTQLRQLALRADEIDLQVSQASSNAATTREDADKLSAEWSKMHESIKALGIFNRVQGAQETQEEGQLKAATLALSKRIHQLREEIPNKEKMRALVQEAAARPSSVTRYLTDVVQLSLPGQSSAFTLYQCDTINTLQQYEGARTRLSQCSAAYREQRKGLEAEIASLREKATPTENYHATYQRSRQEQLEGLRVMAQRQEAMKKELEKLMETWKAQTAGFQKDYLDTVEEFQQVGAKGVAEFSVVQQKELAGVEAELEEKEYLKRLEQAEQRTQELIKMLESGFPAKAQSQGGEAPTLLTMLEETQKGIGEMLSATLQELGSDADAEVEAQGAQVEEKNERDFEEVAKELEENSRLMEKLEQSITDTMDFYLDNEEQALGQLAEAGGGISQKMQKSYEGMVHSEKMREYYGELQGIGEHFGQRMHDVAGEPFEEQTTETLEAIARSLLHQNKEAFPIATRNLMELADGTAEAAREELALKEGELRQLEEMYGPLLAAQKAEYERLRTLLVKGAEVAEKKVPEEVEEVVEDQIPPLVPVAAQVTSQAAARADAGLVSDELVQKISMHPSAFLFRLAKAAKNGNASAEDLALWKASYQYVPANLRQEVREKLSLTGAPEGTEFKDLVALAKAIPSTPSMQQRRKEKEQQRL